MKLYILFPVFILLTLNAVAQGTLLDRKGQVMRGTPMVIGKNLPGSLDFAMNVNNWVKIKEYGLNTVRVCWVDPYYKTRNQDHYSVEEVVSLFDKCVENAKATGINIIINYHNVGAHDLGFAEDDMKFLESFWKAIAPRYKNNDLVYYEIENEPFRFEGGAKYLFEPYRTRLLGIYQDIRNVAPNRQILLFSFNTASDSIQVAIDNFDKEVDWDYTTIAYHMYFVETASAIEELMKHKTVICTEWDYFHKTRAPFNHYYIRVVDGFETNAGAMEQIGSGWVDWRNWNDTTLNELDTLIIDAKQKGYWWLNNE